MPGSWAQDCQECTLPTRARHGSGAPGGRAAGCRPASASLRSWTRSCSEKERSRFSVTSPHGDSSSCGHTRLSPTLTSLPTHARAKAQGTPCRWVRGGHRAVLYPLPSPSSGQWQASAPQTSGKYGEDRAGVRLSPLRRPPPWCCGSGRREERAGGRAGTELPTPTRGRSLPAPGRPAAPFPLSRARGTGLGATGPGKGPRAPPRVRPRGRTLASLAGTHRTAASRVLSPPPGLSCGL